MTDDLAAFEPFLTRWNLTPDGAPIVTFASKLLPVRRGAAAAMLKVTQEPDERAGGMLMRYWDGDGAAQVLEYDGDGLLLERAAGTQSLIAMVRDGRDDDATRILAPPSNGFMQSATSRCRISFRCGNGSHRSTARRNAMAAS